MSIDHTIAALLERVFDGERLSATDAEGVMGRLMDGELSQMQAAALLAALRTRGETVDEIVGFARAMRERSLRVAVRTSEPLVDICGTGGTGVSTINVSTTAAFGAAAGGVRIAKHGNRGVTKRSGSADLLEALGARIELPAAAVADAIDEFGIGFMFARAHHPAMRFVAPIRSDLGARTIFNNLGPLTNPAGARRHLLGVFDPDLTEPFAMVLRGLGLEHALVVHGDGLDDLSVSGRNVMSELRPDGSIASRTVEPEALGVRRAPREALLGGDAAENALATRDILAGRDAGPKRDVVVLAAGAAFYLAGMVDDIPSGVERARALVAAGAGLDLLERYVAFTRSAAS